MLEESDTAVLRGLVAKARKASRHVANLPTGDKNDALEAVAKALLAARHEILAANALDVARAHERGLSSAMTDRLVLDESRLAKMARAIREVAALPDPVGRRSEVRLRPNGIEVGRVRVPLGVIAMIYESRPNVTSDAAALCLKSGNAVVLRGGSEAFHSNTAIATALHAGLESVGIPAGAITLVPTTDRQAIPDLLRMNDLIDLVIPRGGEGLIRFVDEHSRIPVIKHYKGVCHLYVDASADAEISRRLLIDGKTSRPGVCNAIETLLVHASAAERVLPLLGSAMHERGVELRADDRARTYLGADVAPVTEDDYHAEFLDLILAVRVIDTMDEAMDHIAHYGSNHTEVIVTNDLSASRRFVREVDASVVLVNASSRFSDGGELGLGAEIGISTTKLHAYGPMGLESLTTQKFVVSGEGQTRHQV